MLLIFNAPSENKLQYTESRYVFQRKRSKTVPNGVTNYKTKYYLTKIVRFFVQPCNVLN